MSKYKELAKNTMLTAVSKIFGQMMVFVMLPVYTAMLSAEQYGMGDLIITYAALFAPLILLNVDMAIFRFLIDVRGKTKETGRIMTNALEIVVISMLAFILVAMFVNGFLKWPLLYIGLLYFFSVSVNNIVMQTVRGLGNTTMFALMNILQGGLSAALSLMMMLNFGKKVEYMLVGLALGYLVPAIMVTVKVKLWRYIKKNYREKSKKVALLKYALPLVPNNISWWIFNVSDRTIISMFIGAAANGIYAVANKFSSVMNGLWAIFYLSWSESAAVNIDDPRAEEFFSKMFGVSVRIFGALTLLLTAFLPLVFKVIVRGDFGEALLYVPILMMANLCSVIVGFYSAIYVAKKLTKKAMTTSMVAAAINLLAHLLLLPYLGVWAAAISTLVSYLVMAVYRAHDIGKILEIKYRKSLIVIIFLMLGLVSVPYYFPNQPLQLLGFLLAAVFSLWLNFDLIKSATKLAKVEVLRKTKIKRS